LGYQAEPVNQLVAFSEKFPFLDEFVAPLAIELISDALGLGSIPFNFRLTATLEAAMGAF
jgi:hypothetical protein